MIRVVSWKHKQGISNYGLGAGYSLPPAACVEDSWRLGIAISCNGNHRKMQRLCHIVLPGIVDCGEHPSRQRVDIFVILKFNCTSGLWSLTRLITRVVVIAIESMLDAQTTLKPL